MLRSDAKAWSLCDRIDSYGEAIRKKLQLVSQYAPLTNQSQWISPIVEEVFGRGHQFIILSNTAQLKYSKPQPFLFRIILERPKGPELN